MGTSSHRTPNARQVIHTNHLACDQSSATSVVKAVRRGECWGMFIGGHSRCPSTGSRADTSCASVSKPVPVVPDQADNSTSARNRPFVDCRRACRRSLRVRKSSERRPGAWSPDSPHVRSCKGLRSISPSRKAVVQTMLSRPQTRRPQRARRVTCTRAARSTGDPPTPGTRPA